MPYREKPVEKLYYSIGEAAEMFEVPVSTIRYWENEFSILRPMKNKKGNRLFTPEDIQNLRLIHHLLKVEGMTLPGAKKKLISNKGELERKIEINNSLSRIKELLIDLRDNI